MTTTFADHLHSANAILAKLRGNAPNPERVLADLRQAGVEVKVDGANLRVVGTLTDEQRSRLKECKPALIRLLSEQPVKRHEEFDFFVPDEASQVVTVLLERFNQQGWPETPELKQEAGRCMDAIDKACLEENGATFKRAIHNFVEFIDRQFPRHEGDGVRYVPAQEYEQQYTGWVRPADCKTWQAVANNFTDKVALEYELKKFTQNFQQCDVLVIESNRDPNKEKAIPRR